MKEQRITRANAEAMLSQIMHFVDSGAQNGTIHFVDGELVIDKTRDQTFIIRATGQSEGGQFYPPSPTPLPGYPESMPFIPNEALMVSGSSPASLTMIWWAPREPEALLADLEQQCLASHWVPRPITPMVPSGLTGRTYTKDGLRRHIFKSEGIVTLTHRNR